jgi:hypothetical protein
MPNPPISAEVHSWLSVVNIRPPRNGYPDPESSARSRLPAMMGATSSIAVFPAGRFPVRILTVADDPMPPIREAFFGPISSVYLASETSIGRRAIAANTSSAIGP